MLLDMAETEDDKTYGELDQANKLMKMEHTCACLSSVCWPGWLLFSRRSGDEVFLKRVARPADRRLWNKQEQLQKQAMPPT
jgi:hypothetical protein